MDILYFPLARSLGMANRSWASWGVGLVLLLVVGIVAFWFVRVLVGITVTLVKLGLILAVGLALVYVGKELYDGWSRAG